MIIVILFRVTFGTDTYYDTPLFRVLVGMVYVVLTALLRFLLVKGIFFNRYKEEQGYSFVWGFGSTPAIFLGLYLLIMTFVVAVNGIFNGPCIVESEGYLSFADNTIISVFQPTAGHISFAVLFLAFSVLHLASAYLMNKLSVRPYNLSIIIFWPIMLLVLEGIALLPIPFIAMFQMSHWQVALVGVIAAAISVALVIFMPRDNRPVEYIKQFE